MFRVKPGTDMYAGGRYRVIRGPGGPLGAVGRRFRAAAASGCQRTPTRTRYPNMNGTVRSPRTRRATSSSSATRSSPRAPGRRPPPAAPGCRRSRRCGRRLRPRTSAAGASRQKRKCPLSRIRSRWPDFAQRSAPRWMPRRSGASGRVAPGTRRRPRPPRDRRREASRSRTRRRRRPGRRMRAASANVGWGSIQWRDWEQVTMSAQASSRPVSCANASRYSTPGASEAAASIAGFGSTPTTRSASPLQARADSPVPQPRSTTSAGRSTRA